jgi:cbb3-type cytochrome oxidase subunit 3
MVVMLFLLLGATTGKCVFKQNCTSPTECTEPYAVEPYEPAIADWEGEIACPMFANQEVCCSKGQNYAMSYKYNLLDTTFGHLVGGCDICAANMKLMWCHFTCSPDQSNFVSAGPAEEVPDPISPGDYVLAMINNFTVTNNLACQIYQSCKKCPYVTEVSAMQSPDGFLEFQGYEGIPIGLLWTTFYFDDGPSSLDLEFLDCSANVSNAYGYDVQPCSCNNCELECAANYNIPSPSTLNGLDWTLVGAFYLALLIVSMVVLFIQFKTKKKNSQRSEAQSRYIELDEEAKDS